MDYIYFFRWFASSFTRTFNINQIHTDPMEGHWKYQGGGRGPLTAKFLEAKYEAKLEFPVGGGGGGGQKILPWGGV